MEGTDVGNIGDEIQNSPRNDIENTSPVSSDDEEDDDADEEDDFDEEDNGTVDNINPSENGVENSATKTTGSYRRRNIRKILEEGKLSSATLDAQQQERERLQRVAAAPIDYILSADEAAEIARRSKIWADTRPIRRSKVGYDDIVTLSSDEDEPRRDPKRRKQTFDNEPKSESDDSDVVCLSSDEGDECGPSTSFDRRPVKDSESAHTNDLMNVADDEGQMLINVGHPPTDPDIFLASHLTKIIKPHQLGGVRFLYDNIIESPQRVSEGPGFGCILAHSMGLGKTLQVVSFVDIFYRHSPGKRILVLVPINTLQNWVHEFEHWLPKVSDSPDIQPRQFEVFVLGDKTRTPQQRSDVINEWNKATGVLIMGYEMFRLLSSKELGLGKIVATKKQNGCTSAKVGGVDEARMQKSKGLYQALIDPGADLIVCDEGHRIKNMQTTIAKALNSIKTRRRIVLTGYPLQNNMLEYWCMVNFVRPNYLGNKHEFANMFERPIKNGQCVDSTPEDVRVMRFRVHVLTNLLKGFVQRRSHSILAVALPPKKEYVLFLRKSSIQHKLYRRFVVHCREEVLDHIGSWNALKAFAVCCKIWNHPDILHKVLQNRDRGTLVDNDLDLGDLSLSNVSNGNTNKSEPFSDVSSSNEASIAFQPAINSKRSGEGMDYRWAEDVMESYERGRPENGFKLLLTLAIVEQSVLRDDKILLFSQSLFTLDLIEEFLSKNYVPGSTELWKKNRSYFRLDGSTSASEREKLISRFNNEKSAHLFLISTRAGSLGINLVGANRVIVFDASWNPCHDAQAVCRVYRYGQKKPTFIYRLVMDNSMERTIFNRQIGKQGMAERIIDEKQVDAQISRQDLYNLLQYDENLDVLSSSWNLDGCDAADSLLMDICSVYRDCLALGPVHHESLLLDRSDQILSEHEKREAKRNYEREKKAMSSVGVEGASKKTYAQIAREFRLYNDRPMTKPFDNPLIRPLKCTPLPMNLRPAAGFQHSGVYGDFSNRLIDPAFGMVREEVHRVMAPCSLALPSAQVLGTSGLIVPNEPVDVIKRFDGVYVRTANGHLLDARGSVFDQSWHLNRARSQMNGLVRPSQGYPTSNFNHIPNIKPTAPGEKPEEILLSDDDG